MDFPSGNHGLDLLFKKLGHNIPEIRTRALENILSKLQHGLIDNADIVQERQLMVRLLEWFNFQPSPKQEVVLQLLCRLTKFSSACEMLASLGAVTFLSKLRSDLESSLRPQIDVIIDRLLHVTEGDLHQTSREARRCVYGKAEHEDKTQGFVEPTTGFGYFIAQDSQATDETSSTLTPPTAGGAVRTELSNQDSTESECLRFAGFPWHSLTGTDRHVLLSTGASLCSPSAPLVRNACAFLLDVIFRDFPPEIFLQRPSILQTLLTLISSRPGGRLMTSALTCLQALADGLLCRLHFFQDPAFYCPRQGLPFHCNNDAPGRLSSVDLFSESGMSRSGAEGAARRSGGDGRDDRSSSSDSTRATSRARDSFPPDFASLAWDSSSVGNTSEEEDVSSLQRSRVTVPQFCAASLLAVLPSLKTDSCSLALCLLQVSGPIVRLLASSVRPERLWLDTSVLAQNLQAQVRQLLEVVGDVLLHHLDDDGSPGAPQGGKRCSEQDSETHRLVFHALVVFLLELLKAVLPIDQAGKEVKSSLSRALYVIACDESLRTRDVESCELAAAYLEESDAGKFEVVRRTRKIARSFSHAHAFLKDCSSSQGSEVTAELVELAESSIDGLPYHNDLSLLALLVGMVSRACLPPRPHSKGPNLLTEARRVLLRLLAHPLPPVRRAAYEESLRIARLAVSVDAAANNPGHTASDAVRFLLDTEVLYELCCHGIADSCRLVSHPAGEIIALLMQGRLLVSDDVWGGFCVAFTPVLPVLQAFTGDTEVLRAATALFLSELPGDDFLRASLRALMLKHRPSRADAAAKLMEALRRSDATPHIAGLTDLLIVDTPLSLVPRDEADCFRIRRCVFQEEAVVRMLSVFRSATTEASIRAGALRQLATMLDDAALHGAFLARGGLDSVAEKLREVAASSVLTEEAKPVLASCVIIMKLLLRRDSLSRDRLSRDRPLVMSLLRAADLCRLSLASLAEVAAVIALLVFHDVLREYKRPDETKRHNESERDPVELSLPASVLTRYQVPFLCPSHHTVSIHRTLACPPAPSGDPLLAGPPAAMLRMVWNLSKFDGDIAALRQSTRAMDDAGPDDPAGEPDLELKEQDRLRLALSDPASLSSSLVEAAVSSRSHLAAGRSFSLMRIAMMFPPSSLAATLLSSGRWRELAARFLQVPPSCCEDEALLAGFISLLDAILAGVEEADSLDLAGRDFVGWLLHCISGGERPVLEQNGSLLLKILESSEPQSEPVARGSEPSVTSVATRRDLCKGILCLLARVARVLHKHRGLDANPHFHQQVRKVVLVRLRLADAPQFYDLPSMEVTLECLVHVSATTRRQSDGFTDKLLSQQLLGTLLEIVSAFHTGGGASSLSYMGKGVGRCATQCILHLAREMASFGIVDWPGLLEYTAPSQRGGQPGVIRVGLEWLVPLWSARDPRTRFAGLAIAAAAARTDRGVAGLVDGFQKCPGGMWNMALSVALDHSECSCVRSLAFDLLCNLTSSSSWQGPVVQEEGSGSTTSGLPALLALLHHNHAHAHISLLLARYHPESTVRPPASPHPGAPSSIAGSVSSGTSPLTQTTNPFPPAFDKDITSPDSSAEAQGAGAEMPPGPPPCDWRAVTTPCLVASVCSFLCNMMAVAPNDTVLAMVENGTIPLLSSILGASDIQGALHKLSVPGESSKRSRRALFAHSLLDQHIAVARLCSMAVAAGKSVAARVCDGALLKNIVIPLTLQDVGDDWSGSVRSAQQAAVGFVCCFLQRTMRNAADVAMDWSLLLEFSCRVLPRDDSDRLRTDCCRMLALLLRWGTDAANMAQLLEKSRGSMTSAEELAALLIGAFEIHVIKPSSGIDGSDNDALLATSHALQSLLARSRLARRAALDAGFVERCTDELKNLHARMSLQLASSKPPGDAKRSSDELEARLVAVLTSLLTNLLKGFPDAKVVAARASLPQVVCRLWPWTVARPQLLLAMLRLVAAATAHCERGCAALAGGSGGQPGVAALVVRLCRDVHAMVLSRVKTPPSLPRLAFGCLVNMASSAECRTLMWKAGLLELFPAAADRGQHPKRSKQQATLLTLWTALLLALSFHTDGQLNILKVRDLLDILIELQSCNGHVMLILRNLCFHGPSKHRLSSHVSLVPLLIRQADSASDRSRTTACTAILALLCNSQKAKVHLKGSGLMQSLQDSLARLTLSGEEDPPHQKTLCSILEIMRC